MPLTFIEIEEEKSRRIWLFFLILLLIYFIALAALTAAAAQFLALPYDALLKPRHIALLGVASLIAASIHFCFSALDTVRFVRDNLGALEPDPADGVHKRLINVLQEIQIVTGNKKKINGVVIPTLAMNALAAVDLRGNATIAITEGLLSRLTRPQLEAVVAHEAHHILSGDCLETTVAASLFGLPAAAVQKLSSAAIREVRLSPALLLTWILLKLGQILNLFISREREYRADAGAVRMTRNPLALAEVLDLLSRNWRGTGFIENGMGMLCIVNTTAAARDESEGWWADLMSTHPPIRTRIAVLLKMAHSDVSALAAMTKSNAGVEAAKSSAPVFYALDPKHQWQGPYRLSELSVLPWISPLTWISDGKQAVERAWKTPQIDQAVFTNRLEQEEKRPSDFSCPSCRQPLLDTSYEQTQVYQCHFCGGTLVENVKIPRIMVRGENPSTDRIRSLSRAVIKENQSRRAGPSSKDVRGETAPLRSCPKCKNPMMRTFYSLAYRVEIDRCSFCGLTWFDSDELEMLQCMIANKMASDPFAGTSGP
ncbi:MAG: M48 family metalloprotease [Nitrospirae bacterium]|nr:M48 family metalloprotease [Nitrospirota bacterium]